MRAVLRETADRLRAAEVPSPEADARALIEHVLATDTPLVLVREVDAGALARLEPLVHRRERREPLQLILGAAPFRRLELTVRPGVFVPRAETELAVDLLLEHLGQRSAPTPGEMVRVVDLCTGSGALAAAVLDEIPQADVTAVDLSPEAVELARENLDAVAPGRGRVLAGDVTDESLAQVLRSDGPVDAVLSNPPYVPPDAVPRDPEVALHDPPLALFGGGEDGLLVPSAVLALAAEILLPGGLVVIEHADVHGPALRELAVRDGRLTAIRTQRDLTGRDRFLVARRAADTLRARGERLAP
ncbi:peptide chain release factor N(5)-glutamine methyltransferase [Brachybacterium sp. EF45031]|nr:peptide chain release factor N(5)-glutamine methyltransferase [Brachybacterium sillae]